MANVSKKGGLSCFFKAPVISRPRRTAGWRHIQCHRRNERHIPSRPTIVARLTRHSSSKATGPGQQEDCAGTKMRRWVCPGLQCGEEELHPRGHRIPQLLQKLGESPDLRGNNTVERLAIVSIFCCIPCGFSPSGSARARTLRPSHRLVGARTDPRLAINGSSARFLASANSNLPGEDLTVLDRHFFFLVSLSLSFFNCHPSTCFLVALEGFLWQYAHPPLPQNTQLPESRRSRWRKGPWFHVKWPPERSSKGDLRCWPVRSRSPRQRRPRDPLRASWTLSRTG